MLQTKTAWVLLAGDFAYKIKKPVRFTFVDSSTRAKRYRLCRDEVRLNRRLAPELYDPVAGISEREATYELVPTAALRDTGVIDFAVVMRRLPRDLMLDQMLAARTAETAHLRAVAEKIARFHARASSAKAPLWGSALAVSRLVTSNLDETEERTADSISREQLAVVRDYSRRYIAANRDLLDRRVRDGRVREGHGDLRCDSICFAPEGLVIFDCVEYSQQLRYADAASEIATLATDLDLCGRPDLSAQLVEDYIAASNDKELPLLLPLYQCYRATLRGKLETLASFQPDLPIEQRVIARGTAGRCIRLAATYATGASKARLS